MRKILNIFITLAIFYFASKFFGEYVVIEGTKELIITTLLWVVSGWVIVAICILGLVPALAGDFGKVIALAICVTVILLSTPIRLYLLNRFYDGFAIHGGFLVYLLLTVALSVLTIGDAKKD